MSTRLADDPLREAHQRFLGTIHKNIGDPQPVLIRVNVLYQELSQSGVRLQHAHAARDAALEHGLAFWWRDEAGVVRYGLTPEGVVAMSDAAMPIYNPADIDALQDVVGIENTRQGPDQDVLTTVATHIRSVRDRGDRDV
jgi:hypothetical protein